MTSMHFYTLLTLRGHLNLMSKGMRHSRLTPTKALSAASAVTGKKYKRGDFASAIADINQLVQEELERQS